MRQQTKSCFTALLAIAPVVLLAVWQVHACRAQSPVIGAPASTGIGGEGEGRLRLLHDLPSSFTGESSGIAAIAVDPMGKLLVVAEWRITSEGVPADPKGGIAVKKIGELHVWDVETAKRIRTFDEKCGVVDSMAISPDGRRLATTGQALDPTDGPEVKLWNMETGRSISVTDFHAVPGRSIAFSPNGELLATTGADQVVRICRSDMGDELATLPRQKSTVDAIAFSPDSALLAVSSRRGLASIWDTRTWTNVADVEFDDLWLTEIDFSPDGTKLVVAGTQKAATPDRKVLRKGAAIVCDVSSWEETARFELADADMIGSVAFSFDGRFLAARTSDLSASLVVWSLADGKLYASSQLPMAAPHDALFFSQRDNTILTTDKGRDRVLIWELRYLAASSGDGDSPLRRSRAKVQSSL